MTQNHQAKDILDKDFPEGCPHAEWLERAGVVNPEGDVESSGRNEDVDAAKGDPQEMSVTKPSKNAEGGDAWRVSGDGSCDLCLSCF